jgi:sugar (pentulose or hexulose) kinase
MVFLGIDVGSSSVKAQTIDDRGKQIEFASQDVSSLISRPRPTWAERDPVTLWRAVCAVLRTMKRLDEVETLSVAATSGSVLAVNEKLQPLSPILLYSDKRAQAEVSFIMEKSADALAYEPFLPLDASLATPKMLWLKRNMPNFSEVEKILNETDYVQAKLCGEVYTSPSIAGKAHVDIRSGNYIQKIFDEIGIRLALLPRIQPIGYALGTVTKSASLETGIAEGARVANGLTDATAADLASGAIAEGEVNLSIGTSLVAHAVTRVAHPDHDKRIYHKSYVDGMFVAGGATDAGTLPLTNLARLLGKNVQELDRLAGEVPPTCDGLLAQPQWIGSRIPSRNPKIRGFFIGVTEKNFSAGHLHRSLLEGNAFVAKQVLDIVGRVTGLELKELRTSGGASSSDIQNQIIADVTGKPVIAVENAEASLGCAMLALHSSKKNLPLDEIAALTVTTRKRFQPNRDAHRPYQQALSKFVSATLTLYGNVEA